MNKRNTAICRKMCAVIDSSGEKHKQAARRFICLANKQLHLSINRGDGDAASIAGASYAIKARWETKFGYFRCVKPEDISAISWGDSDGR